MAEGFSSSMVNQMEDILWYMVNLSLVRSDTS